MKCINCEIEMTSMQHKKGTILKCSKCGYEEFTPKIERDITK